MSVRWTLFVIVLLAGTATTAFLWWSVENKHGSIHIGGREHRLLIADEPRERQQGLSGRASLEDDMVMLFVFPNDGRHGIWMKDMQFAIDIIWLDAQRHIVHIEKEVMPETYPAVFVPEHDARYVIEMHAGRASEFSLKVGQQLEAWLSG